MTITELTEALATRKLRPSVAELAKLLDAVYANVWDELGGWLPMDVESAGNDLLKASRDATQYQDDMEERSFERTFGVNA